jgi:hypothetical protein
MASQSPQPDLSSESSLSERGEEDWEDAEPDEEQIQVVSLFDDRIFTDARSMLDYCKERYLFDFTSVQKQHSQFIRVSLYQSREEICVLVADSTRSRFLPEY